MAENVIERPDVARAKAHQRNEAFFPYAIGETQDGFGVQDVAIYIYNVGPLEFNEPRYPNHPHMWIKPCPAAKEYVLAKSLTHPFRENYRDENGNLEVRLTNGYREATRCLSPSNPGIDQNYEDFNPMNVGGNLNNFGVFWSTNEVEYFDEELGKMRRKGEPLPDEVAAAKARLAKTFKAELAELSKIESGVGGTAEAQARANNISHAAANYYGTSHSWHRSDLIPKNAPSAQIECPNCEEKISASAAVCRHCDAVLDEEKARRLFPDRFRPKPGRPANAEAA